MNHDDFFFFFVNFLQTLDSERSDMCAWPIFFFLMQSKNRKTRCEIFDHDISPAALNKSSQDKNRNSLAKNHGLL